MVLIVFHVVVRMVIIFRTVLNAHLSDASRVTQAILLVPLVIAAHVILTKAMVLVARHATKVNVSTALMVIIFQTTELRALHQRVHTMNVRLASTGLAMIVCPALI